MATTPMVRRPDLDDLAAVGALFRARDVARVGVAEVTDDELAHDWSTPGFILERDAWVVEDASGDLIGYADLFPDEPGSFFAETVTATGHEHLERQLIDLVEDRAGEVARQSGPVRLRAMIVDVETERAARFEVAGYRLVRTFFRMRLPPGDVTVGHTWPEGVEPDWFDPERHAEEVHAVLQAAFDDHFSAARPGPFDRWRHDTLENPEFDPSCWVLAREEGVLVGAVVALPEQGDGWIKTLGVLPAARGRGVGAGMLAEAIRRLRARGLAAVQLGVDAQSPTGATRLYERAGMRVVRRNNIYEKVIGSS